MVWVCCDSTWHPFASVILLLIIVRMGSITAKYTSFFILSTMSSVSFCTDSVGRDFISSGYFGIEELGIWTKIGLFRSGPIYSEIRIGLDPGMVSTV